MSGADRGRLFLENAATAAAGTHSVSDTGELLAALGRVVAIDSPVYCPGVTPIERAAAALFPNRVSDYAAATVTVEEVFGAIAETGTLVCSSEGGRAVQAGLLPARTTWRSCAGTGSSIRWTTSSRRSPALRPRT